MWGNYTQLPVATGYVLRASAAAWSVSRNLAQLCASSEKSSRP
jgi:hypothetical protein